MTRNDLALLVFKTIALWIAANGLVGLVGLPLFPTLWSQGNLWVVASVALLPVVGGVLLWVSSSRLAGKVFRDSHQEIPFDLTSEHIPSLASFVVGLVLLAEAVPQGASWVGVLVMRTREHTSVLSSTPPWDQALDEQAVASGVGLLIRVVAGIALVAGSRRFRNWTATDASGGDSGPDE